jgi:hypothetical protein
MAHRYPDPLFEECAVRSLVLLPLLLILTSCATPSTTPRSDDADRELLIAKIEQFNSAIRAGDKAQYGDVFVEDFLFTWSRDGQIYDRATILPNVVPTPDYDPLVDEILVRIHGDSAAINYRVRMKPEDTGVRVTFSCARIDDEWKVLASQSTVIVEEDAAAAE